MINYYQPSIIPFLSRSKNFDTGKYRQYYFHSFEDGLWALLERSFPGKKLHILVPDFYCSDVLDNLKSRGHRYTYYPLGDHFQISPSQFKKYLWLFRPDVIIIFHASGITSGLFTDQSWLSDLPDHSLLVEDSVHRLVNPEEITFLNNRHFIIDSLRKVSPLPGSRLFAPVPSREILQPGDRFTISSYFLRSHTYYFLFRLYLLAGFWSRSSALIKYAHEKILRRHDEIIGDSKKFQLGLPFLPLLFNYLNYSAVSLYKTRMVSEYVKIFKGVDASGPYYLINIPKADYGRLHVYPLGYKSPPSEKLIQYLHSVGIPIWFKFTDSPWSQKRGVLFLPLGFHITTKDVKRLFGELNSAQLKSLK